MDSQGRPGGWSVHREAVDLVVVVAVVAVVQYVTGRRRAGPLGRWRSKNTTSSVLQPPRTLGIVCAYVLSKAPGDELPTN